MTDSTFYELVPPGWLKDYLDVMVEAKNEMPLPFHFLTGAAIIGNILGLRVWATLAKGVRVYPNINVLLLSPAGKCRRGEGTKQGVAIARAADMNLFSGKITPEGLADELVENGNLVLYVEELSMLLTKQDFQRPIIPLLTKLLLHGDGPSEFRTRGLGKRVKIPFINLTSIFTTAPDWFMTTIPEEAYGGGLMSRFLVCCLDEREVVHIDIQAEATAGMVEEAGAGLVEFPEQANGALTRGLQEIRMGLREGFRRGSDDAQHWIDDWYHRNESHVVDDSRLNPHRNRKPANLLRLALILKASAGDLGAGGVNVEITVADLESSLAILNWMEPTLIKLYGLTEEVANVVMGGEKRIIHKLGGAQGKLTHTALSRACSSYFRGGTQEMRRCLEGLMEKGLVEVEWRNGVKVWPPKEWRLIDPQVK